MLKDGGFYIVAVVEACLAKSFRYLRIRPVDVWCEPGIVISCFHDAPYNALAPNIKYNVHAMIQTQLRDIFGFDTDIENNAIGREAANVGDNAPMD